MFGQGSPLFLHRHCTGTGWPLEVVSIHTHTHAHARARACVCVCVCVCDSSDDTHGFWSMPFSQDRRIEAQC